MRKPKIIYLFLLVVILGVAAYLTERKETTLENSKFRDMGFNPNEAKYLTIERTIEGLLQKIIFIKKDNLWAFDPSSDPKGMIFMGTDSAYIDDLVTKLAEAEFESIPLDQVSNADQFRFDKPLAKVIVDQKYELLMSERRNFEGYPYYKLDNKLEVYTSPADFTAKLMNKIIYFQKRHVLGEDLGIFNKIEFKNQHQSLSVLKEKTPDKFKEFLTKVRNMTVQEYLEFNPNKIDKNSALIGLISKDFKWQMQLSLNYQDKKLYGVINKNQMVEFDATYWEYFANLNADYFFKDKK